MTLPKIVQTAKHLIELDEAIERDVCRNRECHDSGMVESNSPLGEGWNLVACPSCHGNGKQKREADFRQFALDNAVDLAKAVLKNKEAK